MYFDVRRNVLRADKLFAAASAPIEKLHQNFTNIGQLFRSLVTKESKFKVEELSNQILTLM